jgi:hypothetical protein
MRGYDSGGYTYPNIPVGGGSSGPNLSTDSLGRSITGGFTAALSGYGALQKIKDDKKPDPPKKEDDPPGTLDGKGLYARGGRIKHTAGPRIGKDDGLIPAQRGEYVIKKSAVKKLGSKVLGQVNKGKLPAAKRGR